MSGEGGGVILLIGVIGERALEYCAAETFRELAGAVDATAVEQNDFIGNGFDRLKKTSQVSLFVLGNDANAEEIHLFARSYHAGVCISNLGKIRCLAWGG